METVSVLLSADPGMQPAIFLTYVYVLYQFSVNIDIATDCNRKQKNAPE